MNPVFLVGPTCVGKSSISINLAKEINAEIVSCDSMQVYRGMDIGTAKPSLGERDNILHHMIDIVDLDVEYNAARYVKDADSIITQIQERNRVPLIAGGTGLYVKALIDGLFPGPAGDREIRDKLGKKDLNALYGELKKVDPVSSKRINQNDKRRIIRALEVFYKTGRPISSFQTQWEKRRDVIIIGLNRDRRDLYNRIDKRVDKMFQDGFVEEVKGLVDKGLSQNKTASQALGYKEIMQYLGGRYTLEETMHLLKQNTRRLAKRQLTWFRKDDRVKWLLIQEGEDTGITVNRIREAAR